MADEGAIDRAAKLEVNERTIEHLQNRIEVLEKKQTGNLDKEVLIHSFIRHLKKLGATAQALESLHEYKPSMPKAAQGFLEIAYPTLKTTLGFVENIEYLLMGVSSEKKSVDVYSAAEEVFSTLNEPMHRNIAKKVDIKAGKYHVLANPKELHYILLQLVENSISAIQERGSRPGDCIRMTAEEYNAAESDQKGLLKGNYVHLILEDNGKGMAEEIKNKAFDPFYSTKADEAGHGLGLAAVHKLVNNGNGHISIESIVGEGTKFHIYLPKADAQ